MITLAGVYFVFLNDVALSLVWHMVHGSATTYDGHTMTLPLMWRRESGGGGALRLARAAFFHPIVDAGLTGPEFLAIGPSLPGTLLIGTGAVDAAAAMRWRTEMVTAFRAKGLFAQPEEIAAKGMTFYCFNRDSGSTHGGALDCKAVGTDWEMIFSVGDGGAGPALSQLEEARGILRSVK